MLEPSVPLYGKIGDFEPMILFFLFENYFITHVGRLWYIRNSVYNSRCGYFLNLFSTNVETGTRYSKCSTFLARELFV